MVRVRNSRVPGVPRPDLLGSSHGWERFWNACSRMPAIFRCVLEHIQLPLSHHLAVPSRLQRQQQVQQPADKHCLALLLIMYAGGDGPKGPADNYRSWGSGDGDFGYGHGNGYMHLTPVALGVVLAGMMVATWQAGPPAATAATIADMAVTGVTEDYFEADRSLVQFPSFSAVIEDTDEYLCCGEGFTADEKELVVPKQYRVREWVFVH